MTGTCPDCAAREIDGHLTHDDTCPLGLGCDEIQADDRFWFELGPSAVTRRRPPHWSEIADLRRLGLVPTDDEASRVSGTPVTIEPQGDVVVTRIADGVRTRRFDDIWFAIVPGQVAP
jgi:hypothetical protein